MTPAERIKTQYFRLLKAYGSTIAFVSVPEIADTLYCSPGHARVLLQEMREKGWISWVSRAGRGAKGQLHCLISAEQFLKKVSAGKDNPSEDKLMTTESPSVALEVLIYRPVMSLIPSLYTGRFERHHFRMIHCGLLRYLPDSNEPKADLAHFWQASKDSFSWRFYLRDDVKWHNGEKVSMLQIFNQLNQLIKRDDMEGIFSHIISVNIAGAWCIEINLSRADPLLAHRLANAVCALPHPTEEDIGTGPFRIVKHTPNEFIIRRWDYYHNERPLIHEVHYKTKPGKDFSWANYHISRKNTINNATVKYFKSLSSFTFLTFNYRDDTLSELQQKFLRIFTLQIVNNLISVTPGMSTPGNEWIAFRNESWGNEVIVLPKKLKLGYYYTPHTELLVKELAKKLRFFKCELEYTPIISREFSLKGVASKHAVIIGEFLPAENLTVSMDGMFRNSPVASELLPEHIWVRGVRLLNIASSLLSKNRYERKIFSFANWMLKQHILTPLYSHEYIVSTPDNAKGVHISTRGLPDYRTLWLE